MNDETKIAVFLLLLLLALPATGAAPARAQQSDRGDADLGQLYRRARSEALARRYLRQDVRPVPPVRVSTPRLDSLHALLAPRRDAAARRAEAQVQLPPVRSRRAVRRLGRTAFENRFAGTNWAYLGASDGRALLDTMQTRRLRARLQALYGDPTLAVVDTETLEGRPAADYIQFAYWFVLNENSREASFPVKIVDTGGPFDPGLVFAAPARFRTRLRALREAVLAPVAQTALRARYVDYYFDQSAGTWYRAGFDGRRFFARPVGRSEIVAGQRPVLRD